MNSERVVVAFCGPSTEGRTIQADRLHRYLGWLGIPVHSIADEPIERWVISHTNRLTVPVSSKADHVAAESLSWLQGVESGVLVLNVALGAIQREGLAHQLTGKAEVIFVEVLTDRKRALGLNQAILGNQCANGMVTKHMLEEAMRVDADRYQRLTEEHIQPYLSVQFHDDGCERYSFRLNPQSGLAQLCVQYLESATLEFTHFYLASHEFDQLTPAVHSWAARLARQFRKRTLRIYCASDLVSRSVMDALIPEVRKAFSSDQRECGFHHRQALNARSVVPNLRGKTEDEVRKLMVLNPDIHRGYEEAGLNTDFMEFHVVERIMLEVWEKWLASLPEGVEVVLETSVEVRRRLASIVVDLEGSNEETVVIGPRETLSLLAGGYDVGRELSAPGLVEVQQTASNRYAMTEVV